MRIGKDPYHSTHISEKDLRRYVQGLTDPAESYALEKHLENCMLCNDALEGIEETGTVSFAHDMDDLRERLERSIPSKSIGRVTYWPAVAASVLIVVAFGALYWIYQPFQRKPLAVEEHSDSVTAQSDVVADSISLLSTSSDTLSGLDNTIAQNEEAPISAPPSGAENEAIRENNVREEASALRAAENNAARTLALRSQTSGDNIFSGQVKSVNGEILSGAGVKLDDNLYIQADENGEFSFSNPAETLSVNISYEGYENRNIQLTAGSNAPVELQEKTDSLSEVSVTARAAETSAAPVRPEPTIGWEAFNEDIQQYLKYPQSAAENNISGEVKLIFTVTISGSVTNIRIEESLGYGCDEEAIRLIRNQGLWKPGTMNGQPTAMDVTYSIRFEP